MSTEVAGSASPLALCPAPVRWPCMMHRWDQLTFLHWRYDPEVVQSLLPADLTVETIDGDAWVGLVPFSMQVRPPRIPAVPWISNFAETNVRTYVRGADGSTGVWFFSLDAARLAAVVTARTIYRLPYFWSQMSVNRQGGTIHYRCRRRWPRPKPAYSSIRIAIGQRYEPQQLTDLEHRLTARWKLYSRFPKRIWAGDADHPPWILHWAEALDIDDSLVTACGLPEPAGDPLVHYSPGTEVRIGFPGPVR